MRRDDRIVHVSMEITEGRQAFINRIEIVGNVRTRDKVIRREIPLIEGDVFNSALLQAEPTGSGGLGFFEEVKLDTRRGTAEDKVDVVVDLKEKPTGAFTIGGGFSSVDGLIGAVSISQSNLFGYGKRATVGSPDRPERQSVQSGLHAIPISGTATTWWRCEGSRPKRIIKAPRGTTPIPRAGDLRRACGSSAGCSDLLSYTLENVVIKDLEPFAPLIIVQQALENGGEATTSALSLALTRDTRDSFTEPTRGNKSRIAATYAGGFLGVRQ